MAAKPTADVLPMVDRRGRVHCQCCLAWTDPAHLQPGIGVLAGSMVCATCNGGLRLLQAIAEVDDGDSQR